MSEVKIGVSAGVQGVDAAIQKITATMNKMGAEVAKVSNLKFEPVDVKLMARDLALINAQMKQVIALSPQLRNALKATGQSGAQLSQIDFSKLSTDPRVAQRMRDRAFLHSVRGTALDPTLANETDGNGNIVPPAPPGGSGGGAGGSGGAGGGGGGGGGGGRRPHRGGADEGGEGGEGGGSWWRRRPRDMGTATALAVGNGIGGPMGNVLTAGIAGGPMGAILAGVTSVIGKGMEWAGQGMDQAKGRNNDLDQLKRSMGDLGISFQGLSSESYKAAQGLGIANTEFVKLEQQANAASGGAYRTPAELAGATRSGADLGRAYGLDPAQGVNFVSGMQRLNSRQNNKELATQLAEAIVNTQGKAMPGEVMQAMQGFAAAQNRFNSGSVDLNRFGNAYGSMLGVGNMTADHASDILGAANSAMQRMGGTEASKNFTMQAFGNLDPISAAMRAEGGLFGNGLDNKDIAGYMSQHGIKDWDSQSKGPTGTNFGVIRDAFDKTYAGRGQYGTKMELDAEKNYFGLKSYADTASFMNMSDSDHNGISTTLKNAGLNLSDVREGGLQAIAGISQVGSFDALDKLYKGSIRGRGDMSPSDLNTLDKAEKGGNFQEFQNELVRVLAGKGQEDDQATTQRSIDATLSDIKTKIGDGLLPMTNTMMMGIIKMAGLGGPDAAATGAGAPYGFGSGPAPVGGTKGIVVSPGGVSAASGGSTVGGRGNARDMSGHVDNSGAWISEGLNWLKNQGQDGSQPLGIRNNNPLNMLTNNQENSYANPIEGIGAATANLEHGYRGLTLAGIEDKWTGGMRVKGNTPQSLANYMKILADATGLKADDKPNLDDPKVVASLMRGMIRAENGKMPYSDGQINAGVSAGMGKIPKGLSDSQHKADARGEAEYWSAKTPADRAATAEALGYTPTKIPANQRASAAGGALPGTTETRDTNGDIVINLNQTVNGANGSTKSNKISAKVSAPRPSGLQAPYIIEIPAGR